MDKQKVDFASKVSKVRSVDWHLFGKQAKPNVKKPLKAGIGSSCQLFIKIVIYLNRRLQLNSASAQHGSLNPSLPVRELSRHG